MNADENPTLGKLLNHVENYLLYVKEEGSSAIEMDRKNMAELSKMPSKKTVSQNLQPVSGNVAEALNEIAARVAVCKRCRLCEGRTKTVPGQGSINPEIMFIGEGPGADEDRQGLAFVGRAGQLLTKIIEAMGLTRDQVFIGNVVKCRPPDNRTPLPDEMETCLPFLREQIALLKPKVIVALGATALKGLFPDSKIGITKLRGQWMSYEGIDVMPTYHPAYLLRNPAGKRDVWEDMKAVLAHLGKKIKTG